MPFTKHINYGADKLTSDVASADGTQLDDAWVGTLMYGPLAMTGTDAMTWSDATLNIDSHLDNITANRPTKDSGVNGNIYTLTVNGQTFQPDYYRSNHTTHYYRINHTDAPQSELNETTTEVDKSELQSLIAMAEERVAEQDKWAPNGYWRLVKALDDAKMVNGSTAALTQKKVNAAAAKLNKAINTMRPGNLAEMEDLRPLTGLLRRAGTIDEKSPAELREAVEYAEIFFALAADQRQRLCLESAAREQNRPGFHVCQLQQALSVGATEADDTHGPLDDTGFDVLKAPEGQLLLHMRLLHGKAVVTALKVLVAEDTAAHDGQIGVGTNKIMGKQGHEVQ